MNLLGHRKGLLRENGWLEYTSALLLEVLKTGVLINYFVYIKIILIVLLLTTEGIVIDATLGWLQVLPIFCQAIDEALKRVELHLIFSLVSVLRRLTRWLLLGLREFVLLNAALLRDHRLLLWSVQPTQKLGEVVRCHGWRNYLAHRLPNETQQVVLQIRYFMGVEPHEKF